MDPSLDSPTDKVVRLELHFFSFTLYFFKVLFLKFIFFMSHLHYLPLCLHSFHLGLPRKFFLFFVCFGYAFCLQLSNEFTIYFNVLSNNICLRTYCFTFFPYSPVVSSALLPFSSLFSIDTFFQPFLICSRSYANSMRKNHIFSHFTNVKTEFLKKKKNFRK